MDTATATRKLGEQTTRRPGGSPGLLAALAGVGAALLLGLLMEFARVYFGGNFHVVVPDLVYRSCQPEPYRLEHLIVSRHLRTVINLRGQCPTFDWYQEQCRVAHRHNVAHEDVNFSASRLPPVHELRRLIEVLDRCEYPVLIHCARGADRTGLVAALIRLLYTDDDLDAALWHLGPRYGHLPLGRTAQLDDFFELYREWLARAQLTHTPAALRRWACHEYCPATCRGRVEWLDPPAVLPRGRSVSLRARVTNTSLKPWRFRPEGNAGVHFVLLLHDEKYRCKVVEKAGLFDAVLLPGQSMELDVVVPPIDRRGRYLLLMDLVDERRGGFLQLGSEPLEQEILVQ